MTYQAESLGDSREQTIITSLVGLTRNFPPPHHLLYYCSAGFLIWELHQNKQISEKLLIVLPPAPAKIQWFLANTQMPGKCCLGGLVLTT